MEDFALLIPLSIGAFFVVVELAGVDFGVDVNVDVAGEGVVTKGAEADSLSESLE